MASGTAGAGAAVMATCPHVERRPHPEMVAAICTACGQVGLYVYGHDGTHLEWGPPPRRCEICDRWLPRTITSTEHVPDDPDPEDSLLTSLERGTPA